MMTNLREKIEELNGLLRGRQPIVDEANPGWHIEKVYYDEEQDEVFFAAAECHKQEDYVLGWTEGLVRQFNSIVDDLELHGIRVIDQQNPEWFLGPVNMDASGTATFKLK